VKLLNFLEDIRFNTLRGAMGAPLSTHKLEIKLPSPTFIQRPPPAPIIPSLPTEGLDVEAREISSHNDATLIYKNKRVLIHIRDSVKHVPRFHIANCSTLLDMKSNGRFARYVASEREDGSFFVRMNGRELAIMTLPVCQNCLERLSWKGFSKDAMTSRAKQEAVETFSIQEFFRKYPHSLHPVIPVQTVETAPVNEYPLNWDTISNSLREQLGYVCQSCNLVVGETYKRYLHVHHINGVKKDCRQENLRCLCVSCHSMQPLHENLKNSPDLIEFLKIFSTQIALHN
jgi:hypothetical protein